MKAFSMAIRTRVLTDYQAGANFAALALRYHVTAEWVRRFIRKYEATGEIEPRSSRNRRVALHIRMGAEIRAAVAEQPDLTREKLRQRLGVNCTLARLSQSLRALNISFKKTLVAAEQARPDVAERRAEFQAFQASGIDPDRFVFLDVTWIKTDMTRLYGWGPTDQRVLESVPHGHGMTTTFLGALRSTGLMAPLVVDGAINGDIFKGYVEQHLVNVLKPGDIVVMDNLSSHTIAGVREAIRGMGADVLYLPPYRPDLNPIEMVFS